jgi:hypothetical protein
MKCMWKIGNETIYLLSARTEVLHPKILKALETWRVKLFDPVFARQVITKVNV